MIWNIILCALCAAGLLSAVWLLAALILLPVRDTSTYMVLLASGNGERLEQQCRAYLLLNGIGVIRRPMVIADDGLDGEGKAVAAFLAQDHAQIRFCTVAELREILHTGK